MRVNVIRVGLVFGVVLALMHGLWSALVAAGFAQLIMDFILHLHFLKLSVGVAPFDLATAAMLVGITFASGFIIGGVVALLWNALFGGNLSHGNADA